jgi:hypothetical protein
MTLLLVQVLREELNGQVLKQFSYHHVILGAYFEYGELEFLGQLLHLLGSDNCVFN